MEQPAKPMAAKVAHHAHVLGLTKVWMAAPMSPVVLPGRITAMPRIMAS